MTDGHFRGRQKLRRPAEGLRPGRPCLGSACLPGVGSQGGLRPAGPGGSGWVSAAAQAALPGSRRRLRPQGPLHRVLAPLSACQGKSSTQSSTGWASDPPCLGPSLASWGPCRQDLTRVHPRLSSQGQEAQAYRTPQGPSLQKG